GAGADRGAVRRRAGGRRSRDDHVTSPSGNKSSQRHVRPFHARNSRPPGSPPPPARARRVGRPDPLRRVRRQAGLEALVRVVLDPRLLGVRDEPEDAPPVRHRRAGAARRRLPHERRRHEAARHRGGGNGPSVLTEAMIGGAGALIILLFVFGTVPAIAIPLAVAISSILNTFTLVWLLTYLTNVSIIVQFLIALVGLGVAIDYALLMIFRFRDELREGEDVETALVETMTHAGRSVIVSGSTVAVGLLSMVILPLPFIRS